MRLITNTNIIVDDFELAKDYKIDTFIHFLTHFHQDHWQGMTPLWNYGKIYCSKITKQFILNKFPKIDRIIALDFNHIYYLNVLNQELTDKIDNEFTIEVVLFSANHIPGSSMFLFRGYMGTILHTGDFRFNNSMIIDNSILFPQNKVIQIDELIFDNTYCDPMFNFPTADIVAQQMIKIIENNIKKRVLIAMGALGKETIVMEICKYFKTKIIVTQEKYNQLIASSTKNIDLFTIDKKEYFIEIIKRSHREQILQQYIQQGQQNFICINTDFLMQNHRDPDGINYMVPYSLHSNYLEMRTFVNTIKPAILKKLVIPYENFAEYRRKVRINPVKGFQGYLKRLKTNGESGYSTLIRECTDFTKISKNYTKWMTEPKFRGLMDKLGVQLEPDRKNRKRKVDQVMPKPTIKQCIRELEKQCIYSKKPEKVESLEDISNRLKATNNNHYITKFLKKPQQSQEIGRKDEEDEEIYNIIQEYLHFNDDDMKFINRCLFKFSANIIRDQIYEFDKSAISLSVRINSLKDFNDFQKLRDLKIHRIIYNLNDQTELMDFLAEHNDECIKKIFDPSFFIFRGVSVNIPTILRDGQFRKLEQKALLQICQHLFKLKTNNNKTQFQVFMEEFLSLIKEELDDLQSVIENSFNFEVNHVLNYNPKFTYDLLFKLANQQKTLKSVNFNIYRYANPQQSELDQNRQILATLYQHVNEQYNTIFLKNFIYEDQYIEQQNLSEGIVSYSHLVDMLKLMHFRGSLVFEYNKNLERNVEFIDQLLQSSKYILCDKHKLGEEHESHIVDGDTMPPIDV